LTVRTITQFYLYWIGSGIPEGVLCLQDVATEASRLEIMARFWPIGQATDAKIINSITIGTPVCCLDNFFFLSLKIRYLQPLGRSI
jgi:hypothetical protein